MRYKRFRNKNRVGHDERRETYPEFPTMAHLHYAHKITFCFLLALVFTIPLEEIIVIPGLGTLSRLLGFVAFLSYIVSIFITGKIEREISLPLTISAVFLFWATCSITWSKLPHLSFFRLATLSQGFILAWLVWIYARKPRLKFLLLNSYVLGCFAAAIYTFFFSLHGDVASFRVVPEEFNANKLAITLAIGVPLSWMLAANYIRRQRILIGAIYLIYIPAAYLSVLLSASRGGTIILLLSSTVLLLRTRQIRLRYQWLLIGVSLLCSILLYSLLDSQRDLDRNWERLSTITYEVQSGDLNSRRDIWDAGMTIFPQNPILGVGLGGFRHAIASVFGEIKAPHNGYFSILIDLGIVGLLLYLIIFAGLLYGVIHYTHPYERNTWLVIIACIAVYLLTANLEISKITWLFFGLIAGAGNWHMARESKYLNVHHQPVKQLSKRTS